MTSDENQVKYVEESLKIAEIELENVFSDEAFLCLVLQILISVKRIKLSKEVLTTSEELHALEITKEFVAASNLVKMFEQRFHVNMSADKIGYMTLNLINI